MVDAKLMSTRIRGQTGTEINRDHHRRGEQTKNYVLWRVAFEFRHPSWLASEIFDLLRQHRAALCVAESDELQTPDVVTAPFCCYRLRKSDYGPADLQQIEKQLADKAAQGDVFAYIKHEDTPKGALQAASLLARLKAQ